MERSSCYFSVIFPLPW